MLIELEQVIDSVKPDCVLVYGDTNSALACALAAAKASILMIEPVGRFDVLLFQANANCILTDSGSTQKEVYWAGGALHHLARRDRVGGDRERRLE